MRSATRTIALLALSLSATAATAQTGARNPTNENSSAPSPTSIFLPNAVITEAFDVVGGTPPCPTGWNCQNLSNQLGTTSWFQGNAGVFPAQAGAADAYIGANFNNTTGPSGVGTISNWLLTPQVNFFSGATLSFWTRTVAASNFPDRLEVRLSTAGASTNVGANETSVGDFTTLLLTINPNLATGSGACPVDAASGYPGDWCQVTIPIPGGISGSGRIAFRYTVPGAGPNGSNSNFIGIDTFSFDEGTPGTDLALSQSSTATSPVAVGSTFTKTLTVTNNGPSAANSFTVVDTLPSQLTFVSSDCGATAAGQTVTWNGGALAFPGTASCTLTVQVVATGSFSNTASITASDPADTNQANNTSTGGVITGSSPSFIANVPTLGSLGLALMAGLLALFGWMAHRRRTA